MSVYNLYLDESETHNNYGEERVFCIAGIIVEENNFKNLIVPSMNKLKRKIWSDIKNPEAVVLHEKDIRFANNFRNRRYLNQIGSEFHRFSQNSNIRTLYKEIENIYSLNLMTVIGSCVILDDLYKYFHTDIISDKYIICMQILLENFCQFLKVHNSTGHIFCESRGEVLDKEIRMKFNHIKAMGSMYISPYAIQTHLNDISFPAKNR
jgi:hypothetical protein